LGNAQAPPRQVRGTLQLEAVNIATSISPNLDSMSVKLPERIPSEVLDFLLRVVEWAKGAHDIYAIALVGSQASGDAGPSSDIDLIILAQHPDNHINDRNWLSRFGDVDRIEMEDWGKVTSLRAYYFEGLEVEFGIAGLDWASDPSDQGDAQVIEDGIIVLYDTDEQLSERIARFG
jgi:predicted nucleotidyltransferase